MSVRIELIRCQKKQSLIARIKDWLFGRNQQIRICIPRKWEVNDSD